MLLLLKEILTAATSIIAIVLSFIALVITIKNRRNPMRETIYLRQLDTFELLKEHTNKLSTLAFQYFYSNKKNADERFLSIKESSKVEINKANTEFMDLLELKLIILPTEVFTELQEYGSLINDLIINLQEETLAAITTKFINVENMMREFIGLEKLSEENRKLVR